MALKKEPTPVNTLIKKLMTNNHENIISKKTNNITSRNTYHWYDCIKWN